MSTSDPRFSTAKGFDRTVVEGWVKQRNLGMLNEWFTLGDPHKRLAEDALRNAVRENWLEGAQRIWEAGWVPKGTMLATVWHTLAHFGGWRDNAPASPLEQWAERLTWNSTTDQTLAKVQRAAQLHAIGRASYAEREHSTRWDRFMARGPDFSLAAGRDLLDGLLERRYGLTSTLRDAQARTNASELADLDRRLDQLLTVPIARRAPLTANVLVDLLWRSQDGPEGMPGAWERLQQLMAQPKPGFSIKERALMACEMAIVGRAGKLPSSKMSHVLERLIAWNLPLSVTFTAEEMAYGGAFYNLVHYAGGYVSVQLPGRRDGMRGDYTDRISEKQPTLHVGDHWFFDVPGWDATLNDAQKLERRARLNAAIETPKLRRVLDDVASSRPSQEPVASRRRL